MNRLEHRLTALEGLSNTDGVAVAVTILGEQTQPNGDIKWMPEQITFQGMLYDRALGETAAAFRERVGLKDDVTTITIGGNHKTGVSR